MKGYVAQRRGRFYAVIYQGRDPITGKERRSWHPAGTDRAEAERLAARLAAEEAKKVDAVRSLTFGAYLTSQWLPAKKLHLIIRGSLTDAHRRGLVTRNVALVARAPKQRSPQRIEGVALTEDELRQLLRTAAGHRFFPIYWLTAMTGCAATKCWGCSGPTSTSPRSACISTGASSPSATRSTKPAARP